MTGRKNIQRRKALNVKEALFTLKRRKQASAIARTDHAQAQGRLPVGNGHAAAGFKAGLAPGVAAVEDVCDEGAAGATDVGLDDSGLTAGFAALLVTGLAAGLIADLVATLLTGLLAGFAAVDFDCVLAADCGAAGFLATFLGAAFLATAFLAGDF